MRSWNLSLLTTVFSVVTTFVLGSSIEFAHSADIHQSFSADVHESLKSRVPSEKLAEVRGFKNPVQVNEKSIALGKSIFNGKGTCANCHGEEGKGNGPLAESFDPRPRDFCDADDIGWHKARTDGEIFWVISKGTESGMIPFEDMLSEEERWALVSFIRELGKQSTALAVVKVKK